MRCTSKYYSNSAPVVPPQVRGHENAFHEVSDGDDAAHDGGRGALERWHDGAGKVVGARDEGVEGGAGGGEGEEEAQ